MADHGKILLIDDDTKSSHDLGVILDFLGEKIEFATSARWKEVIAEQFESPECVQLALIGKFDADVLHKLVESIRSWEAGIPLVLLGFDESLDSLPDELASVVTATIPSPPRYQNLLDALHKAQVYHQHYNRLRDIGGVRDYNMFRSLVGKSPQVQRIRQVMGQVADKEVTVLITGESGTGKEVVARNLHMNSQRAGKPFVPINCGAIPPELLESELFGHEKGAFTGAISTRVGRFELAEGGTLFLDEIGDMPLPMQVKLLRVLQEHSYERVGGTKTISTNVRIFAATHKNLEDMIEEGTFRQDLYYRVNVFPIEMPSLRERADDIPYLLNELISRLENEKRGSVRFNSSAIASLCRHPWPGNVRELANLVERMAILHPHGIVGVNDLPYKFRHLDESEIASLDKMELAQAAETPAPSSVAPDDGNGGAPQALLPLNGLDLKEYLSNLEKDLIEQALNDSGGVVARAADRLKIRRTTLVEKMRKYEMQK
ncbi:MAG: sigma-54 dependent transcriptional regulator [Pseudohongiellaceae bacterium]|nr:sigma-54 dependent transcriptional regulator [Pseudohongiellaceae bacterium]